MNYELRIKNYENRLFKRIFLLLLICFVTMGTNAQRFEIHAIKDFSNNATSRKAWGVGGAIDFNEWVKNTTFRANVNWATWGDKSIASKPKYNRFGFGISAFYSLKIVNKTFIELGAEVDYYNLRHTYMMNDSINNIIGTIAQTGHFVGVGPHVGLRYALSPRFNVVLNFVPSYLISVSTKVSVLSLDKEYKKGVWIAQLQLGLTFQLNSQKEE